MERRNCAAEKEDCGWTRISFWSGKDAADEVCATMSQKGRIDR